MSQKVSHAILDSLSSVKLTLVSLTLIGVFSILGTLIEQNRGPEFYSEVYPETLSKIILIFGLDDLFHTKWFIGLLFLFFINLSVCSVRRIKRDLIKTGEVSRPSEYDLRLSKEHGERLGGILEDMGYKKTTDDGNFMVFEKNRLSRYAHHIVHLSIIFILIGGLLGLLYGFRGSVSLKKGEEKSEVILRKKNPSVKKLDFTVRLKEFTIDFYEDGTPKDYVSQVEILRDGKIILEREIKVNKPLSIDGMNFYQASYGKEGKFYFSVDGEEKILTQFDLLRMGDLSFRVLRYESSIHNFGPGVLVAYMENDKLMTTWFLRDVEKMKERVIAGKRFRLNDVKEELYTVLEVTSDPGVPLVWIGFSGMILGLFFRFFFPSKRAYVSLGERFYHLSVHCKMKEVASSELERIKRRLGIA